MIDQGERLKILGFRVRHDINQNVFSRGIISRNQLSNIESGRSNTSEKALYQMYLRICEYMVVLDDYSRFEFKQLTSYPPYKRFSKALDFYDKVCDDSLDKRAMNDINLELNHTHFGMFNTFILNEIGNRFMEQNDPENAYSFYLKAYYNLTSCNIDEVTIQYVTQFILKVAEMAYQSKRYFNTIEMLDHLIYAIDSLKLKKNNKDYLFTLAMAYRALGFNDKALGICKRIAEEHMNLNGISQETIGVTYHLLGVLQHEFGFTELAGKNIKKAEKLIQTHGNESQLEACRADGIAFGYLKA